MKRKTKKVISILVAMAMVMSLLTMTATMSFAADGDSLSYTYGDYQLDKITNPGAGSGEADGINTNDETGYDANRLNSYAWAVASRGDYIYIGTNRTLFGSALNTVAKMIKQASPDTPLTREVLNNIVAIVSGGDVPVNLKDTDYVPQIIRFDVKKGTSKVIYQPSTKRDENGVLYYTDKNGKIIPDADVVSETASFRSVVKYKGNLYFGSLGIHMLQLVRIDSNDDADLVYQTLGQASSLRAGCVYNDGKQDLLCFGGQDTTYDKWRQEYGTASDRPLPIVIRYLDPSTAGGDKEDWSGMIADYSDFGKYAKAKVYVSGGGNVWDLCSYNGKLYLILAYDGGWAMFRGEKGGLNPNQFGWTWTEIVGDNGDYPLAMDRKIGVLNKYYEKQYGCAEFGPAILDGAGLLDSTATPYVYKGKMYIGTFDNATAIQAQTVIKYLVKLQCLTAGKKGPTFKQIYAPIYEVLKHPQRIWVMDENEQITPVDSANELLKGTTNDYVWRFIQHHGKLYTGTFDSSTAYNYYLGLNIRDLFKKALSGGIGIRGNAKDLSNGNIMEKIGSLLDKVKSLKDKINTKVAQKAEEFMAVSEKANALLEKFYNGELNVEDIVDQLQEWKESRGSITDRIEKAIGNKDFSALIDKADAVLSFFDVGGLIYWAKARKLVNNADKGFDLLTTGDGENWDLILNDGINDRYNYGGRTLTTWNEKLFVGTANPYYGAQLWQITDTTEPPATGPAVKLKAGKVKNVGSNAAQYGTVKSWASSNKKVAKVSKGKITALKKGSATITATYDTGCKTKYKVTVTTSPKLSKKSVKVKKGKTVKVKIIGKASAIKNTYKNTNYAKITSKRTAVTLKVKGLKKGKTTLKIKVNGVVTLKLKVTVKK